VITESFGNVNADLTKRARSVHQVVLSETANGEAKNRVVLEIRDGSESGSVLASVSAAPGETKQFSWPAAPLRSSSGVFVKKIGGGTAQYSITWS
jgi:hypothetical protein